MIHHFFSGQFLGFLVTGGIAALVNFFSRILFNLYWSFSTSVILAYLAGMCTAFVLAKLFVFKESTQSIHRSAVIFALVNVVAVAQTWGISMGLDYYILPGLGVTHFTPEIAHAAGVVFPVFTSYLGHKRWSFQ
ncbi:GtrA family protein [Polynucleobacter paneuropaeus]|nr:GtrA family protein [Polynucleobacter paneuropaeus]